MIEHLRTSGFKGLSLDEDIPHKVLYLGKNGKGKTARSDAIALALYGYIPFATSGKRPSDIFDSYASSDSLVVSATVNGIEFARKFTKSDKGSVSQSLQVDKKKVNAQKFAVELDKSGAPVIVDISSFMSQSDSKKIDTFFDLFPVDADLKSIDNDIERHKTKISNLEDKKKGCESTIKRLSETRIDLPSSSLAEVQDEIKKTDKQIADLEKQIRDAEIEEAKQSYERTRIEDEQIKVEESGVREISEDSLPNDSDSEMNDFKKEFFPKSFSDSQNLGIDLSSGEDKHIETKYVLSDCARDSIQKFIDALSETGCSACAALIVAKVELKKYKEN